MFDIRVLLRLYYGDIGVVLGLYWDNGKGNGNYYMVVSQNPQYRPQNTIILIIGTPKMVPLILGNPNPYKTPYIIPVSISFSIFFSI